MPRVGVALFMLLVGGVGSAFMLTRLDRESLKLLEADKRWYKNKKRGSDESELRKIRRKIKVLYNTLLIISVVMIIHIALT
jgi:hypothetical protein